MRYNFNSAEYNGMNEKQKLSKQKLNHLILNYLIIEGYEEATINFAKEIGLDLAKYKSENEVINFDFNNQIASPPTEASFCNSIERFFKSDNDDGADTSDKAQMFSSLRGISTMSKRNKIKLLILNGQIPKAINRINEYFPTLLDMNPYLHFKLLRSNLIEMIRDHKTKQLLSSEKRDPTAEEDNENMEQEFLRSIISFVKEKLIDEIIDKVELLKELEMTMSLICFDFDDLPKELTSLFDMSLRRKVANLVNKSILNLELVENHKNLTRTNISHVYGNIMTPEEEENEELRKKVKGDCLKAFNEETKGFSGCSQSYSEFMKNDEAALFGQLEGTVSLMLESNLEKILKLWSWSENKLDEAGVRYPKLDIADYKK